MAQAKRKKTKENKQRTSLPSEVVGVILCGAGLLLLLSLLSYSPADLPIVGLFGEFSLGTEAQDPRQNFIGPLGVLLGFAQIQFLGFASYLLPIGLIWMGVAKLFLRAQFSWRTWLGLVAVLLSAAAFLGAQPWFFHDWSKAKILSSPGGGVGYGLGQAVFHRLLSTAGSLIVLGSIYLISVITLLGLRPFQFIKLCWSHFSEWRARAKESKEHGAKGSKPLAKKTKKKPGAAEEEGSPPSSEKQEELPLREVPKPQIIDASQRIKPSESLGSRPFERKNIAPVGLSTDGFENYELPGFDLLSFDEDEKLPEDNSEELLDNQSRIIETLQAFNVKVTAGDITRGPTITRYEIYPEVGLRVSRISQLEADIARATKAERINILAPIPGKDTVGIEIANSNKVAVPLRELLQDDEFRSSKRKIPLALGKDVYGKTVIGDLAAMPHLLVAGATGSGKSVCINSIITSILFKFSPDELRFIMVDPKVVEMQVYSKLPHLVVPVVTDPKKVVAALRWTVNEMERRYRIFAKEGVRNFDAFNNRPRPEKEEEELVVEEPVVDLEAEVDPEHLESIAQAFEDGDIGPPPRAKEAEAEEEVPDRMPYIVVIIDELADLMQTAPADVEMNIARIAQKARAAGIHLIVATQTPRADVVTGIIKANIPSRIAFQVSSKLDSRVILDNGGAEKLVGKGDMLFLPPGSAKLERSQGAFVSDEEVEAIVKFCADQSEQRFEEGIQQSIESGGDQDGDNDISDEDEEVLRKCIEVIQQEKKASTSLLQRRLRLGYTRAARMMDVLEQRGVIGPGDGAKPREILISTSND